MIVYLVLLKRNEWASRRVFGSQPCSLRDLGIRFLLIIALAYWVLLLLLTQYPPYHWDAISHHLVLSREYLVEHRLVVMPGIPHPVLPALNHMLFTWALALKDEPLAQMIEHTFFILTALGLYSWGKRQNESALGMAAAAGWLGCPLALWLQGSAYVDMGIVCFVFLGVYSLRIFWDKWDRWWWYLGMALLGMAAGVKLTGLFFPIAAGVLGLWPFIRSRVVRRPFFQTARGDHASLRMQERSRFGWQPLVHGWALAFIILLPWYAFIAYHTGNPIWPTFPQFGRGIWGSPEVAGNFNNWFNRTAEKRTLVNFLRLPFDWMYYPERFQAEGNLSLFPLIVAWPLSWIVGFWNRSVRWWALWGLAFTIYWFMFPHLLRYWLPALPFAILALYESMGLITNKLCKTLTARGSVWVVVSLSAVLWGVIAGGKEIQSKGLPPVKARERAAFTGIFTGHRGIEYLNKQSQDGDVVAVINAAYLNYYFRARVIDFFGPLYSPHLPVFRWPDDEQWMRQLESENVTWIFINHVNFPGNPKLSMQNPILDPFWPDYEIAYLDEATWVFRLKSPSTKRRSADMILE
jgi:hypothetical protein